MCFLGSIGLVEAYLELKDVLHIVEFGLVSAWEESPSAIDPCQSSCPTQLTLCP